jgi:hypothetical protein
MLKAAAAVGRHDRKEAAGTRAEVATEADPRFGATRHRGDTLLRVFTGGPVMAAAITGAGVKASG